jgi:hypothetical protein
MVEDITLAVESYSVEENPGYCARILFIHSQFKNVILY